MPYREALYHEMKEQQPSKQKRRTDFQMPTWEQILYYELQERSYVIYEHWHKKTDLHKKAGNILTCIYTFHSAFLPA